MNRKTEAPSLYLSLPQTCSYLQDLQSQILFLDPDQAVNPAMYDKLLGLGFRRSGKLVYRPHCPHCGGCIPVRISIAEFRPSRGQRRTLAKNRDLHIRVVEPYFDDTVFSLYGKYQNRRHQGAGMDNPRPETFTDFLVATPVDTRFVEFREPGTGRLLAVAVADLQPTSLSAVYTFFDPDQSRRGLGTLAILWQVEYARKNGLEWLYLGYWIENSPKMSYKQNFQPLQTLSADGQWHLMSEESDN
ncbi:MAG: arginyltransferase [Gammaproteobacteria bacterium]|nr:arginyltransferase [Gammaproteobacteria bacterium]